MDNKKILYVEDDEALGFLTADQLQQVYDVTHCKDGQEAFQVFLNETFDLCILDVMLPLMDGFELATEIRKRNQHIPILFLSAKTLKEDRIKGLKIGADDYMVKPYNMEELLLKIEVFIRRSQRQEISNKPEIHIGLFSFFPDDYQIMTPEKVKISLTERETALLKLFVDHPNKVLKREDILLRLWGSDDYFLGRSLDVFISRLRKIFKNHPEISIENIPRIGFKLTLS
jgi:DNA-binding response OmpR family regulator